MNEDVQEIYRVGYMNIQEGFDLIQTRIDAGETVGGLLVDPRPGVAYATRVYLSELAKIVDEI